MRTVSVNKFDDGMTNDPRDPREAVCRIIKHFDNYTHTFKLTPHRSMKLDAAVGNESSLAAFRINKMVIGNGTLYGVGTVDASNANTKIYTKTSPGDPTSPWTAALNGSTGFGVEANIGALLYKNYIYGVSTTAIWKYGDITATPSFTAQDYIGHIPTAPGIVHSKYDIMYWPSNNLIIQNDLHSGSGWSVALTLPVGSNIKSICEDGDFVSIACDQPDGTCVVYRWDTQTTVNDLTEKIDWGNGSLKIIENIGGILCGILTTSGQANSLSPKVHFGYYSGTTVVNFETFECTSAFIISDKQKYNNLCYFLADMTINGTTLRGLWKIFKKQDGTMTVSYDISPRNDVSLNSGSLHGFIRWGDYVFISYNNSQDADNYTIWRTDDQRVFTATSVYESTINPKVPTASREGAGEQMKKKQVVGAALATEPLQSGQRAKLYIRKEGGAWKNVVDSSEVGEVVKENTFTSELKKIANGREYEIRLESTGGAEITGYAWKYEPNTSQIL